ncbi:MAG: FKBP-type peptidyl-prolyl cis-trans isomerase [Bacteroidetes bacterium]|nr:FKBP-type peptidyl-prolyl cis-trans isomerase [Bacteroidota bacterium]
MRNSIMIALSALMIISCGAQTGTQTKTEIDLNNPTARASYSLGVLMAQNLKKDGMTDIDVDALAAAVNDVLKENELKIDEQTAQSEWQSFMQGKMEAKGGEATEAGKKFLEENSTKEGVVVLPSGLQYKILKEGDGPKPGPSSTVKTHYHGTLIDGTVFDSSVDRGEPISFPVNGVIKGWTEALQLMPVGSKWQLYIPSDLAYGPRGAGGAIGPNSTLIFDVELLGIEE